jgi:hypothetical protein
VVDSATFLCFGSTDPKTSGDRVKNCMLGNETLPLWSQRQRQRAGTSTSASASTRCERITGFGGPGKHHFGSIIIVSSHEFIIFGVG